MVQLQDLYTVYFLARKNKRRSEDAVLFELDYERGLTNLQSAINERTYRADANYTFISLRPKPREVFACELEARLLQWYIIWRLLPILGKVLTPRSYNNRKGMGVDAAVNQVREDIIKVSQNYTRPAYAIQWDAQGYFPNANTDIAREQLQKVVLDYYNGPDKDDLLWMISIVVNANPQRHCYRKSPIEMWTLIPDDKSLFKKPDGIGGAIGFLIWQIGMNLYLNDIDKWISEELGIRYVRYVDDSIMIVEDKEAALALLPLIREKYAAYGVRMHPRKFRCQEVSKGVEFLATHIKFGRLYIDNHTIRKAECRIRTFNKAFNLRKCSQAFLCTVNSYFGMLKHKSEYRNIQHLYELVDKKWLTLFHMDWTRLCLVANKGYEYKDYLIYKTS